MCNFLTNILRNQEQPLERLDMIPPIHRNCQCSLAAMDNWLYQVYNQNQREMLPYMTQMIGVQDGLFYMTIVDDVVNTAVLDQAKIDVEDAAKQAGTIYDTVSADAENQMARQLYPSNLDSFTPSTDVLYVIKKSIAQGV